MLRRARKRTAANRPETLEHPCRGAEVGGVLCPSNIRSDQRTIKACVGPESVRKGPSTTSLESVTISGSKKARLVGSTWGATTPQLSTRIARRASLSRFRSHEAQLCGGLTACALCRCRCRSQHLRGMCRRSEGAAFPSHIGQSPRIARLRGRRCPAKCLRTSSRRPPGRSANPMKI